MIALEEKKCTENNAYVILTNFLNCQSSAHYFFGLPADT